MNRLLMNKKFAHTRLSTRIPGLVKNIYVLRGYFGDADKQDFTVEPASSAGNLFIFIPPVLESLPHSLHLPYTSHKNL